MSEDKTSGMIARANAEGGAAFPLAPFRKDGVMIDQPGMSLRDWFAGQALAGVMANSNIKPTETFETIANHAFAFADAMLAERERTKPVEAKPDADWTPHNGGSMPCDGAALVDVKFRNGITLTVERAQALSWQPLWDPSPFDILEWRYHKGGRE